MVAVHAEPRHAQPAERLDPRAVEVAEADDGVDAHLLGHQRGVERRPLVGEGQHAHPQQGTTAGPRDGAPSGPPSRRAQTVAVVAGASSGCACCSSGVAGTSSRQLIGCLSCTTWRKT